VTSATFCNSAIVTPSANQAIIVMAHAWKQCGRAVQRMFL
jgi:hypothetical protein